MRASSTEAGRPGLLGRLDPVSESRPDGTTVIRSAQPLPPYRARLTDHLHKWAAAAPDRVFLAERRADRAWRRLTYAQASREVTALAGGLLAHDLSPDRPVAILGGNDIEHALLALAAMEVGIPYCPVSPAYSLVSRDFGKLRDAFALLTPGLVFVPDGVPFAAAVEAVAGAGTVRFATRRGEAIGAASFESLADASAAARAAVAARRETVGPDTIAKFLLTSGSTGHPKAVVNTQRMLSANQTMLAQCFPFLAAEPPVFVDWLPWNHTFGSNHNFGMTLVHGGSLYIDAGKPMPGAVEETVANLREIAPTAYFNVPKGYEALLPLLRADAALRATFFSRLGMLFYAGAGLSQAMWDAYQDLAIAETGARIPFVTGLGATETAPSALMNLRDVDGPGNMGHPMVGVAMKLVPAAGKLEVRIKVDCVTPGYWRSPDLTAAAFDEEGYYRLGDAVRYAVPGDPDGGFLFDGRISEDFKLATGTWVSVGPLRAAFLAAFHPLARDVVIAGHDRDDIAVLVFPDLEACRAIASGPAADPLADPAVRAAFADRLAGFAAAATGSSNRVRRLVLLAEPPSIDRGEVTDKGSINQRAVLVARAGLVADLYAEPAPAHVIGPRETVSA